jgi:AhpC/TSA family
VKRSTFAAIALLALLAPTARAQQPAAPAAPAAPVQQTPPLEVGVVAPDFTLPGGTRFGVLRDPVRLSDFHGKTVILAFFYRSRTRG